MVKTSKVIVGGMRSTGKTAILEQLIYGNVTRETVLHPTIEDTYIASIETERGTKEKIRFYDTEGFDSSVSCCEFPRHYFSFVDAFVLVYDIDRPESFQIVNNLKKDIDKNKEKKDIIVIVLGNKMSSTGGPVDVSKKVDGTQAQVWAAREKVKLFEVTAMERLSLYEPFVHLTSRLNPPPSKSTFAPLSMVRKSNKD